MLRLDVNFAAVDVADEAFDVGVGRISQDDYRVLTRVILQSGKKGSFKDICVGSLEAFFALSKGF